MRDVLIRPRIERSSPIPHTGIDNLLTANSYEVASAARLIERSANTSHGQHPGGPVLCGACDGACDGAGACA